MSWVGKEEIAIFARPLLCKVQRHNSNPGFRIIFLASVRNSRRKLFGKEIEMAGGSSFLFHPFLGSFCVTACVTQSEGNNGKPIFILRPLFSRKNGTGTQQGRRGFSFFQYVKVADIWLRFSRIYFAVVRMWVYVVGEVRASKTEMGASFCGGFPSPIKQRGRWVGRWVQKWDCSIARWNGWNGDGSLRSSSLARCSGHERPKPHS